jgi:hypothetical protein
MSTRPNSAGELAFSLPPSVVRRSNADVPVPVNDHERVWRPLLAVDDLDGGCHGVSIDGRMQRWRAQICE